jgi:hypothetical protein
MRHKSITAAVFRRLCATWLMIFSCSLRCHHDKDRFTTLIFALRNLKQNGWFVVEDINNPALPVWDVVSALLPDGCKWWRVAAKGAYLFVVRT